MPDARTKELRLADARDRLLAEREELAERAADLTDAEDEDDARAQAVTIREEAEETESHAHGLHWAVEGDAEDDGFDGWGEDATVTIRPLTAGDSATVDQHLEQSWMGGVSESIRTHARIAVAIEDAPFVEDGADLTDAHAAVAELAHDGFVDWLAAEVESFSTPDLGNWQSFSDLVGAKLSEK